MCSHTHVSIPRTPPHIKTQQRRKVAPVRQELHESLVPRVRHNDVVKLIGAQRARRGTDGTTRKLQRRDLRLDSSRAVSDVDNTCAGVKYDEQVSVCDGDIGDIN